MKSKGNRNDLYQSIWFLTGITKQREDLFRDYNNKGLAKLENKEFSRLFMVRTTDQIECHYILTPIIMETMVKIYKKFKAPIRFPFIGSRVYIAIDFSKDFSKGKYSPKMPI